MTPRRASRALWGWSGLPRATPPVAGPRRVGASGQDAPDPPGISLLASSQRMTGPAAEGPWDDDPNDVDAAAGRGSDPLLFFGGIPLPPARIFLRVPVGRDSSAAVGATMSTPHPFATTASPTIPARLRACIRPACSRWLSYARQSVRGCLVQSSPLSPMIGAPDDIIQFPCHVTAEHMTVPAWHDDRGRVFGLLPTGLYS